MQDFIIPSPDSWLEKASEDDEEKEIRRGKYVANEKEYKVKMYEEEDILF